MDFSMKIWSFLLGVFFITAVSCSGNKKTYPDILRPVRVTQVESLEALSKTYTGVVAAEEYSQLAFKISGPLVAMNVDAGQMVKKGQVIAAIDPLDYEAQYEANRASYVTAASQLERDKRLLAMEAISRQEYEIAQSSYVKAKSAYLTSKNTLQDTKLTAPFDGFVESKYVENYQKVQAGEPVIKLVNPYKLVIDFILPETSVGLTKVPMKITVEFDIHRGALFDAHIKEFVDASPDGGGIPVRLLVDDPAFLKSNYNIYPGFSARVNLQIDNRMAGAYLIPLSAVFEDLKTGEVSVFVYHPETQKVERRKIDSEQLAGQDKILVRGGLNQKEWVVVDGVNYINGGEKVRVL